MASRHLIHLAVALSAALVFGLIAHGYVTSDSHEAAPPVSQAGSMSPAAPMMR